MSGGAGFLLQETDEWRDYTAHDVVVYLPEDFEDRRFSNQRRVRAEGYVEGRAEVHVHWLVWVDGQHRPPRYQCSAFRRDVTRDLDGKWLGLDGNYPLTGETVEITPCRTWRRPQAPRH
jgi:hypothetical protein